MKKLTFILSTIFILWLVGCCSAQTKTDSIKTKDTANTEIVATTPAITATDKEIQETVNNNLKKAMKDMIGYINYLFMLIFVITAFTINLFITADGLFNNINFMRKWKSGWIFIWGIILMATFIYLFDYKDKIEIFGLIFSLFISMALFKVFGLDKLMQILLNKFGLKMPVQKKYVSVDADNQNVDNPEPPKPIV